MSHDEPVVPLRTLVAVVLATACAVSGCTSRSQAPCAVDAVTARAVGQLSVFTGWLEQHGARGVIGEVGWPGGPDAQRWNALAATWYDAADAAGVATFGWAGAEQWPADYPLAVYRSDAPGRQGARLDVAGPQATVIENRTGTQPAGIALADGSFGASVGDSASYSSSDPGRYGADYRYPSARSFAFLRGRGIRSVRVAFQWERVQPHPGGALSQVEVTRLRALLVAAAARGVQVVLDLHGYGRFAGVGPDGGRRVLVLGSPELPSGDLVDLWRRLAGALVGAPARAGYGLMNEPHDLPGGAGAWEQTSREAAAAIRKVDRTTPVLVGGYASSGAASWATQHAAPWIPADAGPVLYEAHQYFDDDRSGTYARDYAFEDSAARERGWGCPAP